jgi:hypothetical protein
MNIIATPERLRRGYCISAAPAALDRTPSRHNRPCRSSHSLHSLSVNLLLAVIACAIFAGNTQARAASRGARLIVQRAPNFGNDRVVQLWIDRRKVAEIPRDQHYEGFVSGGHHTLGVLSLPNTESRQPTGMGLTLRSGRTYIFTAQWDSVRGTVLKRSTTASDTTAVKMPR